MINVNLAGVIENSIVDGEGMRFVIFTQGCPHHCPGCQNPKTHSFKTGTITDLNQYVDTIVNDPMIKGVTLSGGEPFCQATELAKFSKKIKEAGKDVWVYTGYTFEELIESDSGDLPGAKDLLKYTDVLVDGKFIEDLKSLDLKYKGSSNQRIIDVKQSLITGNPVLMKF